MLHVHVRRRIGALDLDVSFTVDTDEILAVHGPSGSGKTTLINLLAGLERPDSGRIVVGERVLFDSAAGIDVRPEARQVGYVFQDCRLFPHMSVASNLRYGRHRSRSAVSFDDVVELLDLGALLRRRPRFLSGGEKQRVAIGRALLSGPSILLLDEPLASLDPARKAEILPFLRRLRDACSLPMVYVTHAPDEIAAIADRTIRIENGRMTEAPRVSPGHGMNLVAEVRHHEAHAGVTVLRSPLGELRVPLRSEPPGSVVRVAIAVGRVDPIADAAELAILPPPSAGQPLPPVRSPATRNRTGT